MGSVPVLSQMGDDMIVSLSDIKTLKGITLAHWNARSVFPKFEEVLQIMILSSIEIFAISETWLGDVIPDEFMHIDGYITYRQDRNPMLGRTRGGGLIVYVNSDLTTTHCPSLSVQNYHVEILTIKLKLTNVRDIYIMAVYRPPLGILRSLSIS